MNKSLIMCIKLFIIRLLFTSLWYKCKTLLHIQSIYYVQEDKKDILYYPQIRVEQCGDKNFIEYNIAHKDFIFKDSEPESEE